MNFSLPDKAMASQVKKNKNQFIRKATASSSVNKTIQDVSNVDVSAIQSGVESVQIDNPNVNTSQINVHLTNTQTCTEGVKPFVGYEQPTCTEAGSRSGKPEENFDPGGTMHAPTTYNQYSDYVPKLHSDSHFKPSTGSSSQSAIKISASGNFSENQAAENPRTLEDLPFMTGAAQRSRHSEAPGHPDESHTDTNVSHLVHQHVPGSRHFEQHGHRDGSHTDTYVSQLRYQHMLNQGNTTPSLGQQTSEGALYDHVDNNHAHPLPKTPPPELPAKPPRMAKNETWGQHSSPSLNRGANRQRSTALKKDHSSRSQKQDGHHFSNNLDDDGEEKEDIPWEYPGERKVIDHHMMASNIQYPSLEEQAQMQYGGDGIWYNNEQGGYHDQSSKAGQMFSGQHGEQTSQIPGWQPGEPMQQMQGGLYKGNIGNMHSHGRDFGYTSNWQKEGNSGQLQDGQHAKRHVGFKTAGQPAGSMGPVPTIHHAGTMGQMPYQQNEESMQQKQGGLHGGAIGKMHPHAQFEAMHPRGQEYMGEFQNVHHQPEEMGQFWDFPQETWQGDGQGHANYSQGASNFPGPSTDMTDRELAAEQFDQRMNNPWFQEMVQNMKELVEFEGLIVKDVFPDGNCLFTAVIDQLRVRGNFNFTPSTLRAAAVTFLREHPKQHDGTHLEQFLMNESWDQYLDRMCRDGVWGEHIILGSKMEEIMFEYDGDWIKMLENRPKINQPTHVTVCGAMSEVLKCRIIVLGGMSGKSRTVVQPQHMYDEEEKEMQKEKEEANGCKTVKDDPLKETAKTEGAQSKSLQTGTASSTSAAGAKTKGTDTSQREDKTSSYSKQDKEKKDEELCMGEDLYIGLLGEMHYVSLRKKDWEERLNEKLRARIRKRKARKKQEAGQEDDSLSDDDLCLPEDPLALLSTDIVVDPASGEHLPHLDLIVKHISESTYLKKVKLCMCPCDACHVHCPDYNKQVVGFQVVELERLPSIESPRVHSLLQNNHSQENCGFCPRCLVKNSAIITNYFTPNDTKVVFKEDEIIGVNQYDVILKLKDCGQGHVKLFPADPNLWKGQLLPDESGQLCLKHVQVDSKRKESGSENPSLIAFLCSWPNQANQWLKRRKQSKWIPGHVAKIISEDTCRIIPSSHKKSPNSLIEWKFSFDMAEDKMIHYCLTPNYEKGFYAFKFLVNTKVKESLDDFRDVLRHTFFHACDIIDEELWDRKPASCVLYILTDLLHKLKSGFVPHYFMTSINLIEDLSEETTTSFANKIKLLRCNPLVCTYFLLDNTNLTYTELGKIFNAAVEDSKKLSLHGDIRKTKCEFFIPESIRQICFLVSDQMYEKAVKECFAAFEVMTSVENGITFTDLVQQILIELPLICRWCFAFFLDRSQGMSLLRIVCDGTPSESIVHIFGPGIVRHLGELNVPSVLVCPKHVIDFVEKVTYIVSSLRLHLSVAVALKFFLISIYDQDTGMYTFQNQSLETINIVAHSHSHGNCSCHNVPPRQANLMRIALLYHRLFDACWHTKRMDVFRPFVQKFRIVCENLYSEHYTSILHRILQCYEKIDNSELD